jgi:hypothetical protein
LQRRRELLENLSPVRIHDLDNVKALAQDIDKRGLKTPLLVNPVNMRIIDGNRRHAALMDLGFDSVEIDVTDDLIEIAETIRPESVKNKPGPARVVDYLNGLQGLIGLGTQRNQLNQRWRVAHPELPEVRQPTRQLVAYMINEAMTSSMTLRLTTMIRMVEDGDDYARELLGQIEQGELTANQAFNRYLKMAPTFSGAVSKPGEQNKFLEHAVVNLAGAISAFRTLRSPVQAADMSKHLASLKRSRAELVGLIRALEKEGK